MADCQVGIGFVLGEFFLLRSVFIRLVRLDLVWLCSLEVINNEGKRHDLFGHVVINILEESAKDHARFVQIGRHCRFCVRRKESPRSDRKSHRRSFVCRTPDDLHRRACRPRSAGAPLTPVLGGTRPAQHVLVRPARFCRRNESLAVLFGRVLGNLSRFRKEKKEKDWIGTLLSVCISVMSLYMFGTIICGDGVHSECGAKL
jgi:hypothetical protein